MAKINNQFRGIKAFQRLREEWQHFSICRECGQIFDKRDLGQLMHHFVTPHEGLDDDQMTARPEDLLLYAEKLRSHAGNGGA